MHNLSSTQKCRLLYVVLLYFIYSHHFVNSFLKTGKLLWLSFLTLASYILLSLQYDLYIYLVYALYSLFITRHVFNILCLPYLLIASLKLESIMIIISYTGTVHLTFSSIWFVHNKVAIYTLFLLHVLKGQQFIFCTHFPPFIPPYSKIVYLCIKWISIFFNMCTP